VDHQQHSLPSNLRSSYSRIESNTQGSFCSHDRLANEQRSPLVSAIQAIIDATRRIHSIYRGLHRSAGDDLSQANYARAMRTVELGFCGDPFGGAPLRGRPLPRPTEVDVADRRAVYGGLWTAYYLTPRGSDAQSVVLERDVAGFGASDERGWVPFLLGTSARVRARRARWLCSLAGAMLRRR